MQSKMGILLLAGALAGIHPAWGMGPVWAIGTDEQPDDASQEFTPDPNYVSGIQAVKAKQWSQAILLLDKAVKTDPSNADAWNYLAFSHRQSGNLAKAFDFYEKALALNPEHRGALEYLGEAYLQAKDLPKAESILVRLGNLCQNQCEEYQELATAIQAYKSPPKP